MIVERLTFHANYGRGDELVELFHQWVRDLAPQLGDEQPASRIFTDRTGKMFTVIVDTEFPDFEAYARFESQEQELYGRQEFQDWFAKMQPLVATGERQLLNVVKP